ncbi:hypothetical protein HanXRQr2_Chr11g0510481 [Helianthus annuus]|uniref:Uncharacterized protein n=1 Tax=Helianthus annuus TaxID=4232 RepID=A0A9K3HSL5_HELAN|nr:hypothetical protein HanXRQr2_Chr11g0510481 [Helianthus annuus]
MKCKSTSNPLSFGCRQETTHQIGQQHQYAAFRHMLSMHPPCKSMAAQFPQPQLSQECNNHQVHQIRVHHQVSRV